MLIRRKLQWYVAGLLGIWGAFIISFMIAFFRTSQAEKFQGTPYKSFLLQDSVLRKPQL